MVRAKPFKQRSQEKLAQTFRWERFGDYQKSSIVVSISRGKILFGKANQKELRNIILWMVRHSLFKCKQRDKRLAELLKISRNYVMGGDHDPDIPVEVSFVCVFVFHPFITFTRTHTHKQHNTSHTLTLSLGLHSTAAESSIGGVAVGARCV